MDPRKKVSDYCARKELDEALSFARAIIDPWRRCQSLATVAQQVADPIARSRILEASFKAAHELTEPNRIVTVAAWPLELVVRNGNEKEINDHLDWMLKTIAIEPHAVRRFDALFQVLIHIRAAPLRPNLRMIDALIETARVCPSWKKDNRLSQTVGWVAGLNRNRALQMLELIYHPRYRRIALRNLARVPIVNS